MRIYIDRLIRKGYNKIIGCDKMNLFEHEMINISKIYTVNMYETEKEFGRKSIKHYPVTLHTYELIFFISGERFTCFGNKQLNDLPDSVRYLPKGISEGKYTVETVTPGICIDIYFDTLDPMPDFAINLKNMNVLKSLFLKLYNVWNTKKPGFYSEAMMIFYDIIRKIKSHNKTYDTKAKAKKILPSYNYMLEHFTESDFSYKEMCRQSKLSYDYFKELFINQYSVSPVKFVTALRIEKAKELLITGRYTVTEIAQMCGFENVYYFSNVFKKQVGISPKHYSTII